jgi:hypothetical protein
MERRGASPRAFPCRRSPCSVSPPSSSTSRVLRRIRETVAAILASPPDVLVLIDAPGFNRRVARQIRKAAAGYPDRLLRLADRLGLAAGAGRRDARPMSIISSRCSPSSPRFIAGSAVRRRPMSAIRSPSGSPRSGHRPEEALRRAATPPQVLVLPGSRRNEIMRLSAALRRGAGAGRGGKRPHRLGAAGGAAASRPHRPRSCRGLAGEAAHRRGGGRPSSPPSARRGRRSPVRAL